MHQSAKRNKSEQTVVCTDFHETFKPNQTYSRVMHCVFSANHMDDRVMWCVDSFAQTMGEQPEWK